MTTPVPEARPSDRSFQELAGWFVEDAAVVDDAAAADDLVVEVRVERRVAGHQADQVRDVLTVEPAGRCRHLAGHIRSAPDQRAADGQLGTGHRTLDVA